jgi:5-methylcytosine-specific restriction enzyme A
MSQWSHMYRNAAWRRRRVQQLRAAPLCRLCLEVMGVTTPATIADHVTPHKGDPVLFDGPLQSLCHQCHVTWKAEQEANGFFMGCDRSGNPLDPNHPWRQGETPSGGHRS